ncbi:MAG: hypothetical protein AB7T31_10155 [Gemmatimonadales bacterium]
MRALTRGWHLCLLAAMTACDITDVQAPAIVLDEEVGEPFVEEVDAASLEAIVAAGPAELELALLDDGVTAGEVSIRTDAFSESESIQSRVASLDESGGGLVLALGGIGVTLHQNAQFRVGDDAVGRETFLSVVREDLAAGRHTPVVVERAALEHSPGPQDETFVALDVMIGGEGTPSMRMKVGPEHVHRVANPSAGEPDAWLKVLGRQLGLYLRDGRTHVTRHRHHYPRVVGFGGTVESIDMAARTFTLDDGRTVRVTGRTDVVRRRGHARSLRAAAEALEDGLRVRALGLGVAEQDGRVLALRVALKIEAAESEPVVLNFEGVVVDVRAGDVGTLVELANGTVVQIRATTELVGVDEHSPTSLDELEQALEDGREVVARGQGRVVEEQPLVLDGMRVELQSEALPEEASVSFVGTVDYVSFDGSVVLMDGTIVILTNTTALTGADANSPATVPDLMIALDENRRVELRGEGTLDGDMQVTAAWVELTAVVGTFDVDVRAIDPDSGGLILMSGSFALLTESTVITAVNGGPTDIFGVDAALGSGARVRARGMGFVRGRTPVPDRADNYEVIAVEFEVMP